MSVGAVVKRWGRKWWALVLIPSAVAMLWWVGVGRGHTTAPTRVRVVQVFEHDPMAFTQGLLWYGGELYESTGNFGESTVRRVQLRTGQVKRSAPLERRLFGEGLARRGQYLYQLTWRSGVLLVWDLRTFRVVKRLRYSGEGWGLCFDGERFVMTSGKDRLSFRDPETFKELDSVAVTRAGRRLPHLNELECVGGYVFANVWKRDHIARIDPKTGEVTAWIDASSLRERLGRGNVLNGIAHDAQTDRFFLTGKNWDKLFVVKFE